MSSHFFILVSVIMMTGIFGGLVNYFLFSPLQTSSNIWRVMRECALPI